MATYPIRLAPQHFYIGTDQRKQLKYQRDVRTSERIAEYINKKMESTSPEKNSVMLTFGEIANELGINETIVQGYLHRLRGSSNNSMVVERPKETED